MKFLSTIIAVFVTFAFATTATTVPAEAEADTTAAYTTTAATAEFKQPAVVARHWLFHDGGEWCYSQPIVRPRPKRPCLLPVAFGANIDAITCVPGTYLRSGEHCHVGCMSECDIAKSMYEDEPINNAYKCYDGQLYTPNLQCLDPVPPPPPPPKPMPKPKGCCRGPSGEWLEYGRTYAVKPAGECKDKCKTMWAWCDPVNKGSNWCCGAYCQRVFLPPPAFVKPIYNPWDF